MTLQIQDVGDGEGLDVLDGETGDALVFGQTPSEVADFLRESGVDSVVVLRGALGRGRDEEAPVEDVVSELLEAEAGE